jgi:pilus assembly protein Flp/PilA
MLQYFRNLFACRQQDRGASAVEYGLLVAGIAAVLVTVVFLLGGTIKNKFQNTCDSIASGGNSAAATCSNS